MQDNEGERGDEDAILPSLPDDLGGDNNLKITLGLPTSEEENVKNKKTDEIFPHLPASQDWMRSSSTTTTRKVNKPRFKKSHMKVVSACLLLIAVILALYSLKEDDNTNKVVLTEPPTSSKAPIIPSTTVKMLTTTSNPSAESSTKVDVEKLMLSVVFIDVSCADGTHTGSGTVVLDGQYVLTNYHVISDSTGSSFCDLDVYVTDSAKKPPRYFSAGLPVVDAIDKKHDLAVIKLPAGKLFGRAVAISSKELKIGDKITVLGYPGMGSLSITYTAGEMSGWAGCDPSVYECGSYPGDFYKGSAKMGPGVSGGAVFTEQGEFVGVPTAVSTEEIGDNLGLIRPTSYVVPLLQKVNK